MAETLKFRQTCGSIVGTYINIEYGDTIYDIAIHLGNSSNPAMVSSDKGRLVTAAYKIVDNNFDRDTVALSANDGGWIYCTDVEAGSINKVYKVGINGKTYFDTDKITPDTTTLVKFKFPVTNSTKEISATKVFFALFSTPEGADPQFYDVDKSSLTVGAKSGGEYYYRRSGSIYLKEPLFKIGFQTLLFGTHDIRHVTGDNTGSSRYKPEPCECKDLRYRTFSNGNDNESSNGWDDGGEEPSKAESLGKAVINTTNNFVLDFDIDEGRLKDVIFAQPDIGAYEDDSSNGVLEARWVFKRSRIKFTIPPASKNQDVIVRYKIEAAINNKAYYKNKYISCRYKAGKDISFVICPRDEGIYDNTEFKVIIDRCYSGGRTYSDPVTYYFRTFQKPIVNIAYPKMVRNEATGDGFKYAKILTSNMYSNFQGENAAANKYVCDALSVLIASPRPDSSGIPLFVRYHIAEYKFGRNGCLKKTGNKWSLNSDEFTTAMSVFKSKKAEDYTKVNDILDGKAQPTAYVTNINNCDGAPIILSGRLTDENIRELITGYESEDENGNFIMAKGKKDSTGQVTTLSNEMRLWTCRKWDYVTNDESDVLVLNGYPKDNYTEHDENGIEIRYKSVTEEGEYIGATVDVASPDYINGIAKVLAPNVVGDHCGQPTVSIDTWPDGKPQSVVYESSKAILFRAGYVYLLKMRIFHGAAAGAIGSKYGGASDTDRASIVFGFGENSVHQNSGRYDYSNHPNYSGRYPYNGTSNYLHKLDDNSQYGLDYPYTTLYERNKKKEDPNYKIPSWHGPDDGTSGTPLSSSKLNETYPGFSEADYTLIEPVCPYTSTSNLITVHPSSPQIGVNQWLSFNYRHLSKNIGGIDNFAVISTDNKSGQSASFGKTYGGISNTLTRILSMYTSCAETMLHHYFIQGNVPLTNEPTTAEGVANKYTQVYNSLDNINTEAYSTNMTNGYIERNTTNKTYTRTKVSGKNKTDENIYYINPTRGLRNKYMYRDNLTNLIDPSNISWNLEDELSESDIKRLGTYKYHQNGIYTEIYDDDGELVGYELTGYTFTIITDCYNLPVMWNNNETPSYSGLTVANVAPVLEEELVTIRLKPVDELDHHNKPTHPAALDPMHDSMYKHVYSNSRAINTPLMYRYNAVNKTMYNLSDDILYTHSHPTTGELNDSSYYTCYYVDRLVTNGTEKVHGWYEEYHQEWDVEGNGTYNENDYLYNNGYLVKIPVQSGLYDFNLYRSLIMGGNALDKQVKYYNYYYEYERESSVAFNGTNINEYKYNSEGLLNPYKYTSDGYRTLLKNPDGTLVFNNDTKSDTWAENRIVVATYNSQNDTDPVTDDEILTNVYKTYRSLDYGPLGNTYRWQPVINAVKVIKERNNKGEIINIKTEELQIEKKQKELGNAHLDLTYNPTGDPDLNSPAVKHYKYVGADCMGNVLHRTFGSSDSIDIKYTEEWSNEFDIQSDYFYEDNYQFDTYDNSMSCNSNKRFTINEFPGITVVGNNWAGSSGWPAMYTTQATTSKSRYADSTSNDHNISRYHKYFSTALEIPDSYGHLYSRVPAAQDCENGIVTKDSANMGGIITNVGGGQINLDKDYNNIYPLTRTTHYLYFTTWINTTFTMEIETKFIVDGDTENPVKSKYYFDTTKCVTSENPATIDNGALAPLIIFGDNKLPVNDSIKRLSTYGLSKVYGEDNKGWGRCLSNDDINARKIGATGDISKKTESGGIEVPIMTRYTPLLQPQIASETIGQSATLKIITSTSHNSTIEYYREPQSAESECDPNLCLKIITSWDKVTPVVRFTSGGSTTRAELEEVTDYDINIYYPMINENMTYKTGRPNGGTSGNVMYKDYFLDIDSDPSKSIDSTLDGQTSSSNLDFLGGYGICTAYSIFLVPSDPVLPNKSSNEYKTYFRNTSNHWNYFNQPANYYSTGDILDVKSASIKDAGTVLVAHRIYPDKLSSISYTLPWDDTNLPEDFGIVKKELTNAEIAWQSFNMDKVPVENKIKGRCFRKFNLNFKNLLEGKTVVGANNSDYNNAYSLTKMKSNYGFKNLSAANKLKAGLTYDLVIVPIYDNEAADELASQADSFYGVNNYKYDYTGNNSGTINGEKYGGGDNDDGDTITYYGSNPLVLYNYLQVANIVERNGSGGGGSYSKPSYNENYESTVEPCNNCNITYDDHAIIYPNVDSSLYNVESFNLNVGKDSNSNNIIQKMGIINECPGFWLNNSFKVVLRMPSFRTKSTKLSDGDLNTIEHLSNGQLDSDNGDTANDFEFEDIQIHIGKLSELKQYGYPYEMDDNLNRLISKDDLARAHIISYKDYWDQKVFSKKLNDNGYGSDSEGSANEIRDKRDKCTAGALIPSDPNYKNRFIEVNLANVTIKDEADNDVPIYSLYPEGFYIQFRWKSAYAAGNTSSQWSDWHGGSYDGGQKWWGSKGINYFVPVRNYSDIHSDFRQFIKESYPGSISNSKVINENIDDETKANKLSEPYATGQGSLTEYGNTQENELTNSVSGQKPGYYYNGNGNNKNSLTVPSVNTVSLPDNVDDEDAKEIYFINNHDNPYADKIQYLVTHDINFTIPKNVSNLSQQMWEMLYVDYIIRNMCKLYYKPNHNNEFSNSILDESNPEAKRVEYTGCNLAAPWINGKPLILDFKCVGWDLSEIQLASDNGNNKQTGTDTFNEDKTSPESNESNKPNTNNTINNSRDLGPIMSEFDNGLKIANAKTEPKMITTNKRRWNRNKYYRKPITKQDFDELNEHLIKLTQFIRNESLMGKIINDTTKLSNIEVTLPHEAQLNFIRSRKAIIGHNQEVISGSSKVNNINHTMMGSNYIQNVWGNILKLISSDNTIAAEKVEKNI